MQQLNMAAGVNLEEEYSEQKYMAVQRLRKLFEQASIKDVLAKNKIEAVSASELKDCGIRAFHQEIVKGVGHQAKVLQKYLDKQRENMEDAGIKSNSAFMKLKTRKIFDDDDDDDTGGASNQAAMAAAE